MVRGETSVHNRTRGCDAEATSIAILSLQYARRKINSQWSKVRILIIRITRHQKSTGMYQGLFGATDSELELAHGVSAYPFNSTFGNTFGATARVVSSRRRPTFCHPPVGGTATRWSSRGLVALPISAPDDGTWP